ncbi:MAG: SpoVA/SpoVAEb family sporulation membrane protein [Clostridia bacterium]|nr:SpoVA/SpoVAEb family sporulation membrane protein [Clostridia bacterium]
MDIYSEKGKKRLIKRYTPKTKLFKTSILAFIFGGTICALGEALRILFVNLGLEDKLAVTLVSLSFVAIASVLTVIGLFDRIARHAGAGTLVPITGFSNSVTSEAMDSASEGYVLGVGSKIFTVAGPVLLYGTAAGVVYGIVYFIAKLIEGGAVR